MAILVLLSACNFATSVAATIMMKEFTVSGNASSQSVMTDMQGKPVIVGTLKQMHTLETLPSHGPEKLEHLETVTLTEAGGSVHGFTVEGYVWYDTRSLDLFLNNDFLLTVRGGALDLAGPSNSSQSVAPGTRRMLAANHGRRRLDWCLCCCTFTSGHATTSVSNAANVGAGNGDTASIGNNDGDGDFASNGDSDGDVGRTRMR